MNSFLRLIRIQNLLLIVAVQYFVRYFLIEPFLGLYGYDLALDQAFFMLLVIASVLLAASGYVINDYFDIRIDEVNKPHNVLVGRSVKRRIAMATHLVLSLFSVIISFIVAHKIGVTILGIVFMFSVGLIWFYSTNYKRQFLVGNIVMGFLTALIIIIVPLFEPRMFMLYFGEEPELIKVIIKVVGVYVYIAFLLTVIREIVKDIHDVEGDRTVNSSTMPILIGIRRSKIIAIILSTLVILTIGAIQWLQFVNQAYIAFLYILLLVQVPLFFVIYKLWKATDKNDYPLVSRIIQLIFIAGIFSIPVLHYFP